MKISHSNRRVNLGLNEKLTIDSLAVVRHQEAFGDAYHFADTTINDPDGLSVLCSVGPSVGKTRVVADKPCGPFIQDNLPGGDETSETRANSKYFRVLPVRAADHETLAALLRIVRVNDRCLIIRAAMIDGTGIFKRHQCGWHSTARTDGGASVGPFVKRLGHWLPIDLDGVELPDGIGLDDLPGMLAWLSAKLPEPFRGATFVYQLSSSAVTTATRRLGLHAYFRTAEPIDCRTWHAISTMLAKQWTGPGKWDPSFASGVHKQFVAARYVDASGNVVADPLGHCRIGAYAGDRAAVDLTGLLEAVEAQRARIDARAREHAAEASRNVLQDGEDPGPMVRRYTNEWKKFAATSFGDGEGPYGPRLGYDASMIRLAKIAVQQGERDPDRFALLLRSFVLDVAAERGELHRPGKRPDQYVTDSECRRVFQNALRHVLQPCDDQ